MTEIVIGNVDDRLTPISNEATSLLSQAQNAVIDSEESAEKMTSLLKIIATRRNKSEDARKFLVGPLNEHVKAINDRFKTESTNALDEAKRIGNQKLTRWMAEEREREQREAARRQQEEEDRRVELAAELEEAGDSEGAEKMLEEAAAVPVAPSSGGLVRGTLGGTAGLVDKPVFKVNDVVKLAQARPDIIMAAFGALHEHRPSFFNSYIQEIKDGKEIPGAEIESVSKARVR